MNDTGLLPSLTDDRQVDPAAAGFTEATQRWRGNFLASDPAATQQDFAADDGRAREEEFLRVFPDEAAQADRTAGASRWSWLFSGRALQGAVIANGGALIALALLIAAPDTGSKTGLTIAAMVLGLGLMFAAIAAIVSLDFSRAQARLARRATRLAAISGAVSYGALAIAFPLLLIGR